MFTALDVASCAHVGASSAQQGRLPTLKSGREKRGWNVARVGSPRELSCQNGGRGALGGLTTLLGFVEDGLVLRHDLTGLFDGRNIDQLAVQ